MLYSGVKTAEHNLGKFNFLFLSLDLEEIWASFAEVGVGLKLQFN
jgi:hypothetical protein